jgi:hypothetical protein
MSCSLACSTEVQDLIDTFVPEKDFRDVHACMARNGWRRSPRTDLFFSLKPPQTRFDVVPHHD